MEKKDSSAKNRIGIIAFAFAAGCALSLIVFLFAWLLGATPKPAPSQEPQSDYIAAPDVVETEATDYYRGVLDSDAKKKAYDDIETALRTMTPGYVVQDPLSLRDLTDIYHYVLDDNPDIFWTASDFEYDGAADEVDSIRFEYLYGPKEVASLVEKHEEDAEAAIEGFEQENTQEAILYSIHDWIAARTTFADTDLDQTISGVLDEGEAVCSGYARATKYICDKAGIPCIYVRGHLYGDFSKPHAWNEAVVDGKLLYVDVTWDDADSSREWVTSGTDEFSRSHWTGYAKRVEEGFGQS